MKSQSFSFLPIQSRLKLRAFGLVLTALLVSSPGYAANTIWSNIGLDFNTAGFWSAGVPTSGDVAVFNVARVTNPNLSASLTIQELNFSTASASGYDLTSSNTSIKLTLTNTGTGSNSAIYSAITSGTNTIDAPIVLGAASGTQNFTQSGGGTLIVNGVVSSTNTIALGLRGSGTIELNGANTFSGGASIETANATLVLGNNSALGSGTFSINATSTIMAGGLARIISNAMNLAANTTIGGVNELTFNGDVTVSGGATRTVTVSNTAATTLAGNVFLSDLAGTGRTLTINGLGALTISGVIANFNGVGTAANLTKSGTGTLTLSGANTYSGATTLNSGNVILENKAAFGTSAVAYDGVTVFASTDLSGANAIANTSIFGATGNIFSGSNNIELSGTLTNSITSDTLTNNISGGTLTLSGQVFLSDLAGTGRTLTINGAGALTISGAIANFNGAGTAGNLTYNSTTGGTLTLSGANTYSGVTTLNSGNIILGNKAAFGTSTVSYDGVTVSASTDLSGANAIANTSTLGATGNTFIGINNLELSGPLTNNITSDTVTNNIVGGILAFSGQVNLSNSNTNRTLILSGSGDTVISGAIVNGGTSTSKLTYSGTGTLTLTNNNTYSGATTVNSGTLLVKNSSGSATGTGAVSVTTAGASLSGNGTITGTLAMTSGTNLSLGPSTEAGGTAILRTGALTLSSGSNFVMDLLNTTAGTGYDQLSVTGTVAIGGSNLVIRVGTALNLGDKFFVLLNDSTDLITGMFAQGTTVTSGVDTFLINYADNGDGGTTANDISLTVTGVPEPGTSLACSRLELSERGSARHSMQARSPGADGLALGM
jgi:autotransporter-associated beta strand protein